MCKGTSISRLNYKSENILLENHLNIKYLLFFAISGSCLKNSYNKVKKKCKPKGTCTLRRNVEGKMFWFFENKSRTLLILSLKMYTLDFFIHLASLNWDGVFILYRCSRS